MMLPAPAAGAGALLILRGPAFGAEGVADEVGDDGSGAAPVPRPPGYAAFGSGGREPREDGGDKSVPPPAGHGHQAGLEGQTGQARHGAAGGWGVHGAPRVVLGARAHLVLLLLPPFLLAAALLQLRGDVGLHHPQVGPLLRWHCGMDTGRVIGCILPPPTPLIPKMMPPRTCQGSPRGSRRRPGAGWLLSWPPSW